MYGQNNIAMTYQEYLKGISARELSRIIRKYEVGVESSTPTYVKEDGEIMAVELSQLENAAARVAELTEYYYNLLEPIKYSSLAKVGSFITYRDYNVKNPKHPTLGGLVIGYSCNGNVYKSQAEISCLPSAVKSTVERAINTGKIKYIIKEYDRDKGLAGTKAIPTVWLMSLLNNTMQLSNALKSLKWQITSHSLSSKVFGLTSLKETLVGNIVKGVSVEYGKVAKIKSSSYYITVPLPQDSEESRNIKFCLRDLVPIIPNCNGYTPAKDKTIVIGSIVQLCNDKGCKNISKGAQFSVSGIKQNLQSKKISARSENHKLDIVSGVYGNRVVRCYAKNLKLIKK